MLTRSLSLVALAALLVPAQVQAASSRDEVTDEYVVTLADGVGDPDAVAADLSRLHGLAPSHTYRNGFKGLSGRVPKGRLDALAADPRVRSIEPDRLMSFDAVPSSGQVLPTGVDRIDADRSRTGAGDGRGSVDVDVAVIDTGIDATHPDLNVVGGYNCTSKKVDAWADDAGHGTHVAGVIGARDDSAGVVGVAPGARLWAVKVGGPKGAKISDVICGLEWVTEHAATVKIANMSLSAPGTNDGQCGAGKKNDALHAAVCAAAAAGVVQVVSAGNGGTDLAGSVPAAYPEVLTVTAMSDLDGKPGGTAPMGCRAGEVDDAAATFSNYAVSAGDQAHTVAAPGVCIRTTWLVNGAPDGTSFITASGTSAAAPHAAGVVALCRASGTCAGMTPAQVITEIRSSAARQPRGWGFVGDAFSSATGKYYGYLVSAGSY
jgi:subtilisin family serine protease